ncbi:MAG: hypothetical protein ACRC5C_04640, partial [Bacilli bacterium]
FPPGDQPSFVELGHKVPASLNSSVVEEITRFTKDFLTLVNFEDGPAHTEVKLSSQGIRIIESHTRPGGDDIPFLVELTSGMNLYEMAIAWFAFGKRYELMRSLDGAAIKFFEHVPGEVTGLHGLHNLSNAPGVVRSMFQYQEGDVIGPISRSSDRKGYVVCKGKTSDEAYHLCQEALSHVRIQTKTQGDEG